MSWHIEPGLFRGVGGLDLKSLGIPDEDAYIARYSERTGISINKDDFRFYLAYNMFRMAGILQGIMKRYQDGTASSEQALRNGQAARPMAEMGWDYASGKRSI
jgi:aminoglycoside phosphotransferase (APT) family kinase protein